MDLTEAEDIKKRWQEYTELYKKDLHDPDNHDGVITDLEPHRKTLGKSGRRLHMVCKLSDCREDFINNKSTE